VGALPEAIVTQLVTLAKVFGPATAVAILMAALMAAIVTFGGLLYRRDFKREIGTLQANHVKRDEREERAIHANEQIAATINKIGDVFRDNEERQRRFIMDMMREARGK
jgi:hypothetical protein